MANFIDELFKDEEEKRREEEALARNQAILEQTVLDYTRQSPVMAAPAAPREDLEAYGRSLEEKYQSRPVNQLSQEEIDRIVQEQTAPVMQDFTGEVDLNALMSMPQQPGTAQPGRQPTREEVTAELNKPVQSHSYYDEDRLAAYLKRARAKGETPSFTNIPGAEGFMINSNVGGITNAPPPSSVDGKMSNIEMDVYQFKEPKDLLRAKIEYEHAMQNDIVSTMEKIAEEEGVPQLEEKLKMFSNIGFPNHPEAKSISAQLAAAKLRSAGRLSIGKDGMPMGTDATQFLRAKQQLDLFSVRAAEMAEQEGEDDKMMSAQIKLGMDTPSFKLLRDVGGYTDPASMLTTNQNTRKLASHLSSGKSMDLGTVVSMYPDATDFYVKYMQKNRTTDEAATIASTAVLWNNRLDTAAEIEQGKLLMSANGPDPEGDALNYKLALSADEPAKAQAILDTVARKARLNELERAKSEMQSNWLSIDKLDPNALVGISETDRESAIKLKEALGNIYGDSLPTTWVSQLSITGALQKAGVDTYSNWRELLRRMLNVQKEQFNSQYKDTLGVAITSNIPQFRVWGM